MIKGLKVIIIGFFMAIVKRSLIAIMENYGKDFDLSEVVWQILDKRGILAEGIMLIIFYYAFEWFLKKL